jgi:hypothetical protein
VPSPTQTLNYLLYQVGWFSAVLGAVAGHPWWGTLLCAVLLGVHLALSRRRADEAVLALSVAAAGLAVDSLQIQLGTIHFPAGLVHPDLPPVWMVLLWAQFATTLHFSLRWLRGHWEWAAVLGVLGGPAVFLAGQRLGVVELAPPLWRSLLALAVLWSVAMPLAVRLADRQRPRPGAGTYRWPSR